MASGELSGEFHSEDTMARTLKSGDRVAWRSNGRRSVGSIERKLGAPGMIKGHQVAASEDNPEYLVRSEKSGKIAAHKPSASRPQRSAASTCARNFTGAEPRLACIARNSSRNVAQFPCATSSR
jgi:hypothetical protein